MFDIKQLTNFDMAGCPIVTEGIRKHGEATTAPYYVISSTKLGSNAVSKLGYCCEVKGIGYPIFLTINGNKTQFEVGKTGMFEFHDEVWKNVNGDNQERTAHIITTEVRVPKDIAFTLDYCYEI